MCVNTRRYSCSCSPPEPQNVSSVTGTGEKTPKTREKWLQSTSLNLALYLHSNVELTQNSRGISEKIDGSYSKTTSGHL